PGRAGTPFWTNHAAIETERVPESLVVLGGGAIGAELAQVFARFGSQVSVAEGADRLLPLEEPEAGDLLAGVFAREGITVRTGRPAAGDDAVPRVTVTDAEIGAVGVTEEQARKAGVTVRTSVSQVPESARGWIHKAGNDGFIKLVEDCDRGVLAGATSAGPWGGEVL